jgi:hypothetical protein
MVAISAGACQGPDRPAGLGATCDRSPAGRPKDHSPSRTVDADVVPRSRCRADRHVVQRTEENP